MNKRNILLSILLAFLFLLFANKVSATPRPSGFCPTYDGQIGDTWYWNGEPLNLCGKQVYFVVARLSSGRRLHWGFNRPAVLKRVFQNRNVVRAQITVTDIHITENDRDGDGAEDLGDACPDQPGPILLSGCPSHPKKG